MIINIQSNETEELLELLIIYRRGKQHVFLKNKCKTTRSYKTYLTDLTLLNVGEKNSTTLLFKSGWNCGNEVFFMVVGNRC